MPDVRAQLNYLRISPQKVRLVARALKGSSVRAAEARLAFLNKTASRPLLKLLRSAKANAKNNFGLEPDRMIVKEIRVNEGPTLKRRMPRAFGRAYLIRKRSSHIALVLGEKSEK